MTDWRKHNSLHYKAHFDLRACPMCGEPPLLLSLDDILIIPHETSLISSRSEPSVESQLSPNIRLKIPICSSYMDTVTEHLMAIIMARYGGIGFIHRLMSIEDQAREVERVKRAMNVVIKNPYTISADLNLAQIEEARQLHGVGALLVVDESSKLLGIVSRRDTQFVDDDEMKTAGELMTPRERIFTTDISVAQDKILELFREHAVEQIPLVNENDIVSGLLSRRDLENRRQSPDALLDRDGHFMAGACLGLNEDYMARAGELVDAGADALILAIANGYMEDLADATRELKSKFGDKVDLIVGNVTEYNGAKKLFQAGADTVAVGIGPGSICITRKQTGVGGPLWSSIRSAARAAREEGKYIVADGGMREPNHLVKAIYGGASAVIVGSALAGTNEAPGELVNHGGRFLKGHRGLASNDAKNKQLAVQGRDPHDDEDRVSTYVGAEGVEQAFVYFSGDAVEVLKDLFSGDRSAHAYMGSMTTEEFWEACDKGYFGRQTSSSVEEGNSHTVMPA